MDGWRGRITQRSQGYTLIELLVVIAIIALLAAIAIPQYSRYRERSIDTQIKSDLKNAAVAMESYYAEYRIYPATLASISAAGFIPTEGVTVAVTVNSVNSFTLTASKPGGTQPSFVYTSNTGQID
jgi:prepilin-type N-terminal cleavage/methylation domain-containing protein